MTDRRQAPTSKTAVSAGPAPAPTASHSMGAGPATLTFRIPLPPTANNLTRNTTAKERAWKKSKGWKVGARTKTDAYRAWIEEAGWEMKIPGVGFQCLRGEVEIQILAARPDMRKRDVSNIIKAIEDLLVRMYVIEDDSFVRKVSAEWVEGGHLEGAIVTVRTING